MLYIDHSAYQFLNHEIWSRCIERRIIYGKMEKEIDRNKKQVE